MRPSLTFRQATFVIDLQEGVAAIFGRDAIAAPVENCRRLAAGQPAADLSALLPELNQQPTDLVVTKRRVGAFHGTDVILAALDGR